MQVEYIRLQPIHRSKESLVCAMALQIQLENANKDKQIKILTDQNAELLRLLETEEAQNSKLSAANEVFRKVSGDMRLGRRDSYPIQSYQWLITLCVFVVDVGT